MNRWMLLGLGVLLLAWAPFLYSEMTHSKVEKKGRDLPVGEVEDMEALLAALPPEDDEEPAEGEDEAPSDEETEPTDAPGVAPAESPEPAPAAEDEDGDDEQAEEDGEEAPPPPPPRLTGPTQVLKAAFDNEPRDALWADGAEARIAGIFDDDEIPEGFFDAASCRKAVCKVALKWSAEQSEAYLKVHQVIRDEFGNEIGVEPEGGADEDGIQRINLYVPREGYTVADLSE